MLRLFGYVTFSTLLVAALKAEQLPGGCTPCIAQNIFDEDAVPKDEVTEPSAESEEPAKAKSSANAGNKSRKKKKSRKKRKQSTPVASAPESSDLSARDLARLSYAWAPEPGLQLKSTAPGIKPAKAVPAARAVAPPSAEVLETPVQPQGFKLPQIPGTQVLIVAGFVLLFLIYRFRVGRQMKRRKY